MAAADERKENGTNDAVVSKKIKTASIPSVEEVENERQRLQQRNQYVKTVLSTTSTLIVVAAIAVLLATLFLPVLQVSGSSMEPTLYDGDIIVLVSTNDFETGDLVGFYYQNKLLLKRVIGGPGDIIDIDVSGNVTVNGELLDESYVNELAMGDTDLVYPYQVPENRYFVMGDNRATSVDSRSSVIGCIEKDQIIGKVILRVWPLQRLKIL
ncbi:MAG: signal peptidase I [Erysipelotrichaceae bacterium]|nr:signal peptidase I [Erysipelotrichaceae bacterium]